NRIISVAWELHEQGKKTVFISKDINVRLKSDALGIHVEDFEAQKVDAEHLYRGYAVVDVPGSLIDQLYDEKHIELDALRPHLVKPPAEGEHTGEPVPFDLFANQFVQLRDQLDESHTGLARLLSDTGHLIPIHGPRRPVFGIMARNLQQTM